jgi:hypothetical protein
MSFESLHAEIVILDGRQSATAAAICRGTSRLLRSLGFACVPELSLPSGRRADIVALADDGELWIVEVKSSITDFRVDQKWPEYRYHCDRLLRFARAAALRLQSSSDPQSFYRMDF